MPAVYAHDRFGKIVAQRLTGDLKDLVEKYPRQFQVGLQGPDIFFFYGLHTDNRVVRFGAHLHQVSAMPFFRHALRVVKRRGRDSGEYAYLLGFVCHFVLDSECHPYVEDMIEKTGVKHLEIEEEFEKLLLRMDNQDPFGFPMEELIPTDRETAQAMSPFYRVKWRGRPQTVSPGMVRRSLKDMRWIKKFFTAPCLIKYGMINLGMKLTGKYPYVKGLMHQRTDNPRCVRTNYGLLRRFDRSVRVAVGLMESLDESLRTGKALDGRFDRTFS